jgi:hypothetical protein
MPTRSLIHPRTAALLSLVLLMGSAASAQTRVDTRQENQANRIAQGVESGQLTQAEQDRLNQQQGRIARGEERAAADGTVTQREAAKLNARQHAASRNIARAKHNRRGGNP